MFSVGDNVALSLALTDEVPANEIANNFVWMLTGESHETIENLGDAGPGNRGGRRLVRSRSSHAAAGHARAW